jgi:hypothetical protein
MVSAMTTPLAAGVSNKLFGLPMANSRPLPAYLKRELIFKSADLDLIKIPHASYKGVHSRLAPVSALQIQTRQ